MRTTLFLALAMLVHNATGCVTITAEAASAHVGKSATLCGIVASAKYATATRWMPTFLNLDVLYPNHIFTALIWGPT